MKDNSTKTVDQEEILGALRKSLEMRKGQRITLREFVDEAGISRADVFRNFARWEDALRAAGCDFATYNAPINPALLLTDWGELARELQRMPTRAEFKLRGNYSVGTMGSRFGSWMKMPSAFEEFARDKPEWADILALIESFKNEAQSRCQHQGGKQRRSTWLSAIGRRRRIRDLPVYGSPLDFGGLRHAPVNEQGVVFLFGMMAKGLGFLVESLSPVFPDCEAKRRIGPDEWQRVRIEFEFDSRNFRMHGHDPKGCDVIVCWEHNWAECPLEVVELREEVKKWKGDGEMTDDECLCRSATGNTPGLRMFAEARPAEELAAKE